MSEPVLEPTSTPAPAKPTFTQPISAKPDGKFFLKRMVIAGAVLFVSAFLFYDGYYRYPKHNTDRERLVAEREDAVKANDDTKRSEKDKAIREWGNPHSAFDIRLQKLLGFAFLPIALWLLLKFLKENRGTLTLDNDTLSATGHPPIPIASITGVENAKWDKKGIAIFSYRLADGTEGKVRIDDFVFERPPTDAIHDEIIAKMPRAQEI